MGNFLPNADGPVRERGRKVYVNLHFRKNDVTDANHDSPKRHLRSIAERVLINAEENCISNEKLWK